MEEVIMAGNPNPIPNVIPNPPPAPPSGAEAQRTPGPPAAAGTGSTERKVRSQKDKAINCPRCNSTNTKFCYYNNYSLQQPRYFCKTCRRYWTDGGSLRNLPVGSGSRKNKRSSPASVVSSATASSSAATFGAVSVGGMAAENPKPMHEGVHDLNLAFSHHLHHARVLHPSEFTVFPRLECSNLGPGGAMADNGAGGERGMGAFSAMELLMSTGCYVAPPKMLLGLPPEYGTMGFALGEFRMPLLHQQHHQHHQKQQQQVQNMLGFPPGRGGDARGYGACRAGLQGAQESATGRLPLPFEDLKPGVNATGGGASGSGSGQFEHNKDEGGDGGHDTLGFWNNMIGNGSSNDASGGGGGGGGSW